MPQQDDKAEVEEQTEPLGVLPAGTRLRNYQLVGVLGQGGFGITYRARDTTLDREVAIKEYLPTSLALRHNGLTVLPRSTELAEDFSWGRARFLDEARTLARLEGTPAVVRVIDFLEENGTAYTVMALARGRTLDRRLRRDGPLDYEAIQRLLDPLLDGLERVHAAGFLHRDIKPANIILDNHGAPTLIDFGASRAAMVGRSTILTAIFTPGYAAAEQFTSAKQGPWTDIYGLSATIYHSMTGRVPPSAFDRMLEDAYEPLVQLRPAGFPLDLLAAIDGGLAVHARRRPQSVPEWRSLLRGVESSPPSQLPTEGERTIALPRSGTAAASAGPAGTGAAKRRRQLLLAGVAAAVIVTAAGTWFGQSFFRGASVQTMTADQLQRALEERRNADALAAEKKKLEEEAVRQAAADADAKRKADAELAAAQEQRQKAERELAELKANLEAQRKASEEARQKAAAESQRVLDEAQQRRMAEAEIIALREADQKARQKAAVETAAQQAAAEETQRKAEAQAAAARATEEAAQKKAAADAEAKRQADEALARAQAERQKADELVARQQAEFEARQKADADAKTRADEEAKAKAEAEVNLLTDKKAAEAAETALKLSPLDRQRLQAALTSLGFDTRGTDGVFGPRSREVIAAWQKARNQPPTGFLSASHQQALFKEGATTIAKFDAEQKRLEEEKKKKAEEDAKAREAAEITSKTTLVATAADKIVKEEPPEGALAHGQRVLVDDGFCSEGEIKLVIGGRRPAVSDRTRMCAKRMAR